MDNETDKALASLNIVSPADTMPFFTLALALDELGIHQKRQVRLTQFAEGETKELAREIASAMESAVEQLLDHFFDPAVGSTNVVDGTVLSNDYEASVKEAHGQSD